MEKTTKARVQHKHDVEANWLKATNFTPLVGEIIVYDPDENYDYPRIKIGDGKTNINTLHFVTKDYAKISDIPTKPEDIGALPDSTVIPTVPTKISAFENDKGYLTQHQSLDAYAKTADLGALATKDSLTASDVGALPDTTKIPSALSELTADSTHRTVTDIEKNTWNAKANVSDIPTKVSDLTNDKRYITSYTETDPTVPAWAKADTKPTYTASEVGALPSTTKIPGALSDLNEDATHRVVTDEEKAAWNAKSSFSGNYNDLTNKPTIPSIEGLVKEQDFNNAIVNIDNKLDADKLPEAVNAALAQAKESGEFKGEPGFSPEITISTFQEPSSPGYNGLSGVRITTTHANGAASMAELFNGKDGINGKDGKDGKDGINGTNGTSVTIQSISQTIESGEISTVTFSDGKKLEIANGKDGTNGRDGTDGKDGINGKDGTDGYSGVYVGSSEPPINANVKIDPNGDGSVLIIPDVLQTTGDSEVDTMSQKAITELLNSIGGNGGSGGGEPARSIVSIKRTSGNGGAGSTDTYTITYTDGTTSTFTVYNGKNGTNGTNGTNGKTAYESAKSGGYTGTEANFNTALNNVTKYSTETWTFTLEDGSTVTKKVVIG